MYSSNLPGDIILEILSRLPVKSILRFRSVCKSWLTLLSDPDFISFHRKRTAINPQKYRNFIISRDGYMCGFDINENSGNVFSVDDLLPCDRVRIVVGACNGIVCLESCNPREMILWNPALRMYKEIQCPEVYEMLPHVEGTEVITRNSCGFGLDVNGNDFICLRILCRRWDSIIRADVRVYSTRLDSWKTLEGDFRFQMIEYTSCAIVKGVPYWTAIVKKVDDNDDKLSEVLFAFDVRNEVFKQVEYPEVAFKRGTRAYFVELNDSLASLSYCPGEELCQFVDVWVLNDEECWRKKFTVGPVLMEIEKLVGCSRDGNILGTDTKRSLFVYKSKIKEIQYVHTDDENYRDIGVHTYGESLTSLNGMKHVAKED